MQPFYYVIREHGPANHPMQKHLTRESAEREAERLARATPDQRFLVVRTISSCAVVTLVREEFEEEDVVEETDVPF